MPPALAGVLCGAFMGLVFIVLAVRALRALSADPPGWLRTAIEETSTTKLILPPALLTHAMWTAAGLFIGILYGAVAGDGDGRVLPFVVGVMAVGALLAGLVLAFGGRTTRWLLPVPVMGTVVFGVALPLLSA